MGNCGLWESRSAVTAKLILIDGELMEFPSPVVVSNILQIRRDCFICNSDEMEINELLSSVNGDEELQPGELYFELPLRWLNQRLKVEDIASLAVKASLALTSHGRAVLWCCVSRKVDPMTIAFHEKDEKSRPLLAECCKSRGGRGDGGLARMERANGIVGGARGCRFGSELSVIIEE